MKKCMAWIKNAFHRVHGGALPHWMSILMWILGVIGLIAFSINDICPILSDYYDDDTNVAVRIVVERNGSFKPPQLHLCFPYDPSQNLDRIFDEIKRLSRGINSTFEENCAVCQKAQAIAHQIWNEMNTSDPDLAMKHASKLIFDQIFANASGCLEEDKHDISLQKIKLGFAMRLIDYYGRFDVMLSGKYEYWDIYDVNGELEKKKKDIELLFDYVLSYFCSIVYAGPSGKNLNLSFDERRSTYCRLPGHMANFREMIILLDDPGFCLPLAQESFQILIDVDATYLNDFDSSFRQFAVYTESPIPTKGQPLFVSPAFKDGPGTNIQHTIRYSMQSNVVERRDSKHCFNETTRTDCMNRCRTEKIVTICKCVPFTTRWWTDQSDQYPFCNGTIHASCLINASTVECEKECLTACVYTSYSWQITTTVETNDFNMKLLQLILEPVISPYIEFTISTKDTSKNLISEIGGSLGFYLGFSGLSLIIFVIYCFESVRRWRRGRNQDGHNNPVLPILQWIRMTNQLSGANPQESVHLDNKAISQEIAMMKERMAEMAKSIEELKKLVDEYGK